MELCYAEAAGTSVPAGGAQLGGAALLGGLRNSGDAAGPTRVIREC